MEGEKSFSIDLFQSHSLDLSLDCIKLCPHDENLWAFSYYQQMPVFRGGIEVQQTSELSNISKSILEIGPIMHIQWLPDNSAFPKQQNKYKILAAHRQNKISICEFNAADKKLEVKFQTELTTNIFCLYCDWLFNSSSGLIDIAISTSEQTVFHLRYDFIQNKQPVEIARYSAHEYAVWACRLSSDCKYLITGDEVQTLYLIDVQEKKVIKKNTLAHKQGICEIIRYKKSAQGELILSGSFDGSLAMIRLQDFGQIVRRFEIGGTIWRIIPSFWREEYFDRYWLICNSSQKVFQIMCPEESSQKSKTIRWTSEDKHDSLAYAAQWNKQLLITVSYYDKKMNIWHYNFK